MGKERELTLRVRLDGDDGERRARLARGVAVMAKALRTRAKISDGDPQAHQKEVPLPVVAEVEEEFKRLGHAIGQELAVLVARHTGLLSKAAAPFRLGTRVFVDPATGKPLTQRQWNRLTRAIDGYIKQRIGGAAERLVARQTALGAITQRLEARGQDPEALKLADIRQPLPASAKAASAIFKEAALAARPAFNTERTAQYVTSASEKMRNDIKRVINDGLSQRKGRGQMAQELLELRGKWNRDWDRIVETESQDAFNDGYLASELDQADPGEPVYMVGKGAANACPVCRRDVVGRVVRLLPGPPEGGGEKIRDPHTDTAIWPGKSSVGHGAKESYAVITRHPWCCCRWARTYPEDIEFENTPAP